MTDAGPVSMRAFHEDATAWDAFVADAPLGSFMQLSQWAEANASKGWSSTRVVADTQDGPIGAQILIHRMRPGPWSRGYAPRGPVARSWALDAVPAFTEAVRAEAAKRRLTHVFIDPELPKDDLAGDLLEMAGWQPVPRVQPTKTRVIDLTRAEDELFSGLRSSARWSVNKAKRSGITIEHLGEAGLADFGALYGETVERLRERMTHRADFEAVFRAFDAKGLASIVLARTDGGTPLATLMLISCGSKMNELYGAASAAGFKARANYLVKWEAIRRSQQHGFVTYDMWGTDEPNLAEFKAGFGGEERVYGGAYELPTNRPVRVAVSTVQRVRSLVSRNGSDP